MSNADLQAELRLAQDIAQEAGRIILSIYATDFSVVDKAGGAGPVTEADQRANECIVTAIRKAFPGDAIIAEESKDNSGARGFARCWYIDPLDGTREFVARNGEFAVHVGLAIDGASKLGVVYKPVDRKLYSGIVGVGSTLSVDGASRELHVSTVSNPADIRLLVSRSHKSKRTEWIRQQLGITHVIESGSVGVKCGLLAEGLADLYLHPSPKSSRWDSCAPEAVLIGAGGRFTDSYGSPYLYDGIEIVNKFGHIGSNASCYDAALPVVREGMRQFPPH